MVQPVENRGGYSERGGTWKSVLLNKPHHGRPDASVRHAARLEPADVPKPVFVAFPAGRPPVFTLDTARAFLADHPDPKALSPADRARHSAAWRIVSAIDVSPTFSPATRAEVTLPPVVSVVHFKPVPDAGAGFKDYASAQFALKSGAARAQVPLPAHAILPHSAPGWVTVFIFENSVATLFRALSGLRDYYPLLEVRRCPLFELVVGCNVSERCYLSPARVGGTDPLY
jgi:hypothetical protein